MPYESTQPLVVFCLAGAAVAGVIAVRAASRAWLAVAVLSVLAGLAVVVVDRLVVTDRESLLELFPRLARAAEQRDIDTIIAAVDPELHPLRATVQQAMARVRPTAVVITRQEVTVEAGKHPPEATADLIVRVTGDVADNGPSGVALTGVRVSLRKRDGRWLVTDAEARPVRPGGGRD